MTNRYYSKFGQTLKQVIFIKFIIHFYSLIKKKYYKVFNFVLLINFFVITITGILAETKVQ